MGVGVVAWWGKRTEMNHSTPSIVQNKLLKRKKKKIVLRRELRTLSSAVCLAESLAVQRADWAGPLCSERSVEVVLGPTRARVNSL